MQPLHDLRKLALSVLSLLKLKRASVHTTVSWMCFLTTRRARAREQRWRDGSHGSLEHTDETRREEGRTARREYVFCCSPSLQNQ